MNRIAEAYKKEIHLPYIIVLFLLTQAILLILSLVGIGHGGIGVFFLTLSTPWPYPLDFTVSIILNIIVHGFLIFAAMQAIIHDRELRKKDKDERELLHDQKVSDAGYKISIIGIVFYIIAFPDPLLIVLLLAILIARFYTRVKLEEEN